MTTKDLTEQLLADRDWNRVSALDPAAAARFVSETCDRFAVDASELDSEELTRVGIALSRAPHGAAAEAALAWLEDVPSNERLFVVCILFLGLWSPQASAQCTDDNVNRFIAVHTRLRLEFGDEYWFARALLRAVRCENPHGSATIERLRAAFSDAIERVPASEATLLRSQLTSALEDSRH